MTDGNENVDWARLEQAMDDVVKAGLPLENVITGDMLKRRLAWDILPCEHAARVVSGELGMSPTSPDVSETEHQDAHRRLLAAQPVAPVVSNLAEYAVDAVLAGMIDVHGDAGPMAGNREALLAMFTQVTYAITAELIDMDVLHLPHFRLEEM